MGGNYGSYLIIVKIALNFTFYHDLNHYKMILILLITVFHGHHIDGTFPTSFYKVSKYVRTDSM